MQHFPHLNAILPIVDNAHEMMCGYSNKPSDGEPMQEEEVFSYFNEIKEIILTIQEVVPKKSAKEKEPIMHQIKVIRGKPWDLWCLYLKSTCHLVEVCAKVVRETLGTLVSPSQIDKLSCGSVCQIQAHVSQTQLDQSSHGVHQTQAHVTQTQQVHGQSSQTNFRSLLIKQEFLGKSTNMDNIEYVMKEGHVFDVCIAAPKH